MTPARTRQPYNLQGLTRNQLNVGAETQLRVHNFIPADRVVYKPTRPVDDRRDLSRDGELRLSFEKKMGPGLPQATERLQGSRAELTEFIREQKSRDASVDRNAIRVSVGYHEGPGSAARSQADPGTIRLSFGGWEKRKKQGQTKKKGQIERGGSLPEGLQVEMKGSDIISGS